MTGTIYGNSSITTADDQDDAGDDGFRVELTPTRNMVAIHLVGGAEYGWAHELDQQVDRLWIEARVSEKDLIRQIRALGYTVTKEPEASYEYPKGSEFPFVPFDER